jgi:hypothetical protein
MINYRPISLLTAISKVFERATYHRVHHHLQVSKLKKKKEREEGEREREEKKTKMVCEDQETDIQKKSSRRQLVQRTPIAKQ